MLPQVDPGPTVVVCEDDPPTLELLCDHLVADRFEALAAPSAADALRLCHYKQPDLLLLDLNLPDAPGLDVLREIRAAEGATGSYDPELAGDRAQRPLERRRPRPRARVRRRRLRRQAVSRSRRWWRGCGRCCAVATAAAPDRCGSASSSSTRRGARSASRASWCGWRTRSSACCGCWPREPTRVFTKAELLRDVWGFRSLGRTRTLDSHASRLRRKLDPEAGRYVVNCWGVGYRLIDAPEADDAGLDR